MNEDQLYQQFLNNGGDASYEEFITLYQNFTSNDLDSEKKKNILQPEFPSNSQPQTTALPISNDLELNPAQQEAIIKHRVPIHWHRILWKILLCRYRL